MSESRKVEIRENVKNKYADIIPSIDQEKARQVDSLVKETKQALEEC